MRKFGKIEPKFWTWASANKLSAEAKFLALYLLSSPHSNAIGCYYLPDGYITTDLEWVPETVSKGFAELFRNGFARRCDATYYVWIEDFLNHNKPDNPNVAKSIVRALQEIPRNFTYWPEFKEVLKPFTKRFPKGFETVLEGFGKPLVSGSETVNPKRKRRNVYTPPLSGEVCESIEDSPSGEEEGNLPSGKKGDTYPALDRLPRTNNGSSDRTYPAAFEKFWSAYPRNPNDTKSTAYKAWRKAIVVHGIDEDVLLKGAVGYDAFLEETRPGRADLRKHIQTWINAEGWTAEGVGFDKPLSRHDQALLDWSRGGKVGPPPEAREFGEEDR